MLARRLRTRLQQLDRGTVLYLLVSYVPLLLTHRGKVGADTKAYLYLNPGQLLRDAPYMWDSSVGLGTVTHQNIGYLFPMGPYYWLAQSIGLPDWIAQRLWLGTLIALAGLGLRSFLKAINWSGAGATVAVFFYGLSPYLTHYFYKHSVILLPYVALGWLLSATVHATREGGWRWPARFALITLAAGGINAPSLFFVLLAPMLWIAHMVWIDKEVPFKATIAPLARIAGLGLITSVWWIASLLIAGKYGINVVRYTESAEAVAHGSSAPELFRGLGYWFLYGSDAIGPWFKSSVTYTQNAVAMVLSFAIPIAAVAAALFTRFRYRIFFVAMMLVGMVISVGSHRAPEGFSIAAVFRAVTATQTGLGFRSTPRALPMTIMALAVFLGAGVNAVHQHLRSRPRLMRLPAAIALAAIIANLSPLWLGRLVDETLERPGDIPTYWTEAAARINQDQTVRRVFEMPGIEFADYRWGSTVDPITPGLIDVDYVARELVPQGSQPSANLVTAIDIPLQNASGSPAAIAPLMRLLGVDHVLLRQDLAYERYRTPRPNWLHWYFSEATGLTSREDFGAVGPNLADSRNPLIDAVRLSQPNWPDTAPVELYTVSDPQPATRITSSDRAIVLSGDGAGVVNAAAAGLLDPNQSVWYSGSLSHSPEHLREVLGDGGTLIVTDTNRKAGRRWGTTKDNEGYTERADEVPIKDSSDRRINLFSTEDSDLQTVALHEGGLEISASNYGNVYSFTPLDRPVNAADGDPATSWKVAAFTDPRGEWIALHNTQGKRHGGMLHLVQAQNFVNRWITKIRVTIDGHNSFDVDLGPETRTLAGWTIPLPDQDFTDLSITILATDKDDIVSATALSGVGFAEVGFGDGAVAIETIRPPVDAIEALGSQVDHINLHYLLDRKVAPDVATARDEERSVRRRILVPADRDFTVSGRGTLSPIADEHLIDDILGVRGLTMRSSSQLERTTYHRASQALDGSLETSWVSGVQRGRGSWIDITGDSPLGASVNSLTVVDDPIHSLPTSVRFDIDGIASSDIPLVGGEQVAAGLRRFAIPDIPLTGTSVRINFPTIDRRTSPDWLDQHPVEMPIAVAEVGAPALLDRVTRSQDDTVSACRSDVLTINGASVPIQLSGDRVALETGGSFSFRSCSQDRVRLPKGESLIETTPGAKTGISLDQIDLASIVANEQVHMQPRLTENRKNHTQFSFHADTPINEPVWLTFGQSFNAGWDLEVNGHHLGASSLIDGYANGWKLDPAEVGPITELSIRWKPQSVQWWSLWTSAFGFLVTLVLALGRTRSDLRRRILRPKAIAWNDDFGEFLSLRAAVVWSVVWGSIGAITTTWWGGCVVAALTFLASRVPRAWAVLRAAILLTLMASCAYVVVRQLRSGYPTTLGWPSNFDAAHFPLLIALVMVGADATIEALRGGWRRSLGEP